MKSPAYDDADKEDQPLLKPADQTNSVPVHKGYGARHTFCILAFFGYFSVYVLRFNMSVAIVAMANGTSSQSNSSNSKECPNHFVNSTQKKSEHREFDWDEAEQGFILSSFFYGYIVTQIPGGLLAEKIGGKRLLSFSVLTTAILTLLIPLLTNVGVWALVLVRFLQGLAEGVSFPALFALQGKWTPAQERTTLPAVTLAGSSLGNVVCLPLCGYLSSTNLFGGWPSNFYVFGIATCIWWIFWQLMVHDTPADHPRISPEEKAYIEATTGSKKSVFLSWFWTYFLILFIVLLIVTSLLWFSQVLDLNTTEDDLKYQKCVFGALTAKYTLPWRGILTSSAVWSLCITRLMQSWGFSILLTSIPTYMNRIQKFDITEDGLLMALPNLSGLLVSVFAGWLSDFLVIKKIISVTAVRKLFVVIGMASAALCFSAVSFVGCNHYAIVILITSVNGILGFSSCAVVSNVLDIGNNFAATLMGITNFSGNLSAVASPYVVGLITNHNDTMHQWQIVFYISAGMNVFGVLIFTIFGKGTTQAWNEPATSPVNKTVRIQYPDKTNDGEKF